MNQGGVLGCRKPAGRWGVALLVMVGVAVVFAGSADGSCGFSITINPGNGAGVYIQRVDTGAMVVNGIPDPLNFDVPCGLVYKIWLMKDGHTFEVKSVPSNPAGWTGVGTDVAQGLVTPSGTTAVHFYGNRILQNSPPIAQFTGGTICRGDSFVLDNATGTDANNDPLEYRWDVYNDGTYEVDWTPITSPSDIPTYTTEPLDPDGPYPVFVSVKRRSGTSIRTQALKRRYPYPHILQQSKLRSAAMW